MTCNATSHQRLRFLQEMEKTGAATIEASGVSLCVFTNEHQIIAPPGETCVAVLKLILEGNGQARLQVVEEGPDAFLPRPHEIEWNDQASGGVVADAGEIARLALEILPLLVRVQAGRLDGKLTDDARQASCEIDNLMSGGRWIAATEVWAAEDWIAAASWEELARDAGVSPSAEDALDIIADSLHGIAASEGHAVAGLTEALEECRDHGLQKHDEV